MPGLSDVRALEQRQGDAHVRLYAGQQRAGDLQPGRGRTILSVAITSLCRPAASQELKQDAVTVFSITPAQS